MATDICIPRCVYPARNIRSFERQHATGAEVPAVPGRSSPPLAVGAARSETIRLPGTCDDYRHLCRLCDRRADRPEQHAAESAAAVAAENHQLRALGFLNQPARGGVTNQPSTDLHIGGFHRRYPARRHPPTRCSLSISFSSGSPRCRSTRTPLPLHDAR
jgi:hypothetical protein